MKKLSNRKNNCDGCYKQTTCKYGYIIYDDITYNRMALWEKYIMLGGLTWGNKINDIELKCNISWYVVCDLRKLCKEEKNNIIKLYRILLSEKKFYYSFGKCGRAYWNYNSMNSLIEIVKNAIDYYDKYRKYEDDLLNIKKEIINDLNKSNFLLQKDILKKYLEFDKNDVFNILKKMIDEGIIYREKYSNTFKIKLCD